MTLQSRFLPDICQKLSGFSPEKNKENSGKKSEIEKTGFAVTRSFKSYIMARNFRKIVCDPSKKSDLTLFFLTSKIFFRKLPPLYDVLWLIAPKIQREFSGMRRFSTKAVILALNFEFFPWRCIGTGKLFDLTITEDKSFWLYILKIPEEETSNEWFFNFQFWTSESEVFKTMFAHFYG